jgi:hypothetical protein
VVGARHAERDQALIGDEAQVLAHLGGGEADDDAAEQILGELGLAGDGALDHGAHLEREVGVEQAGLLAADDLDDLEELKSNFASERQQRQHPLSTARRESQVHCIPRFGHRLVRVPGAVGGSGHIIRTSTTASEITLAAIEVAGSKVQDHKWNEVLSGKTLTSLKVSTTGPAELRTSPRKLVPITLLPS